MAKLLSILLPDQAITLEVVYILYVTITANTLQFVHDDERDVVPVCGTHCMFCVVLALEKEPTM